MIWVYVLTPGSLAVWAVLYSRYPWKWVHKKYHPSPGYRETRTLARCNHCHAEWMRKTMSHLRNVLDSHVSDG